MTGYDIVREDFPGLTDSEILEKIALEGDCPTYYGLSEVPQHECGINMCNKCIKDALERKYGNGI